MINNQQQMIQQSYPQQQFMKSYCYASDDAGTIPDAMLRGFNVICLVEPEEGQYYPNCSIISSLLPHPMMIASLLDTEHADPNYRNIVQKYMADYQMYLADPKLEGSMVNILASMYKTTHPILLYCPVEANRNFYVLPSICEFLKNMFGVIVGRYEDIYGNDPSKYPKFICNPTYMFVILDLLFTNGFITKKEYALKIPKGVIPSERAISLILSDFNQIFPTLQSSVLAACNILDNIRLEVTTGKVAPIVEIQRALDDQRQKEIEALVNNAQTRFGHKNLQSGQQPIQQQIQQPQMNQIQTPIQTS